MWRAPVRQERIDTSLNIRFFCYIEAQRQHRKTAALQLLGSTFDMSRSPRSDGHFRTFLGQCGCYRFADAGPAACNQSDFTCDRYHSLTLEDITSICF
jgi:hypothetical protein